MITALAIILGIGVMILIHEYGHFIFARIFGIKVEQFSIGFGPPIFKIQGKETLYKITPFPIGGYIEMKGENPDEELQGTNDEFLSRKPWEKIIIAFAGPFFNIVLAFILLPIGYFGFGIHTPILPNYVQIASVQENSAAEAAGFKRGDIILNVNGKKVNSIYQASDIIHNSKCNTIGYTVKRSTEIIHLSAKPRMVSNHYMKSCVLGVSFVTPPVIGKLSKKSEAYKAGLRKNDKILKVNGKDILSFEDIFEFVDKNKKPADLLVSRDGNTFETKLFPVKQSGFNSKGKIKGYYTFDIIPDYRTERLSFSKGIKQIFSEVGYDFALIYLSLRIVITHPKEAKNLGGPIAIGYIISKSLKGGWTTYLSLISLISVNLAVVNFLPLMVTDGGLILLFLWEWITKKKMKKKGREIFAQIGWALLILLFLFVIFNDIMRFF